MTPPTVSSVVSLLLQSLRPALPAGVLFIEGPETAAETADRIVSFGDPWDDDQQPISTERTETGAGGLRTLVHEVACKAYAATGADQWADPRDAAADLLVAVDAALVADRTLGGSVARARLGSSDIWQQGYDARGIGFLVGFTIEITVFP